MGTGEQRCLRPNTGEWMRRWGCREGKGVVCSHIVDPGLPCSFSEGMLPAERAPATYESGPGVGFCTDAAVDHGYQPVKQPVGRRGGRVDSGESGQVEPEGWQKCCSSQSATPWRA